MSTQDEIKQIKREYEKLCNNFLMKRKSLQISMSLIYRQQGFSNASEASALNGKLIEKSHGIIVEESK